MRSTQVCPSYRPTPRDTVVRQRQGVEQCDRAETKPGLSVCAASRTFPCPPFPLPARPNRTCRFAALDFRARLWPGFRTPQPLRLVFAFSCNVSQSCQARQGNSTLLVILPRLLLLSTFPSAPTSRPLLLRSFSELNGTMDLSGSHLGRSDPSRGNSRTVWI